MHDFDPTVSPYNGHMLRNLSKYYLFICCKQSSSTHFCHFLATAFVTDVLAGSNPSAMGLKKRKAFIAGGLTIQWWAMRDSNPQPCACKAPALTVAPRALIKSHLQLGWQNSLQRFEPRREILPCTRRPFNARSCRPGGSCCRL